jgi:hypothetical protein
VLGAQHRLAWPRRARQLSTSSAPADPALLNPESIAVFAFEDEENSPPGSRPAPLHCGHFTVPSPLHVLQAATAQLHC